MKFFIVNEKNAFQNKINVLEQFIKHDIKNYEFIELNKNTFDRNVINSFVENYDTSLILIFLSHFYSYKQIAENYEEAIILEGDVILNDNFIEKLNIYLTELPKDYDMLFIGENSLLNTYSYIVSKKCAFQICTYIQNIVNKIDCSFNSWLKDRIVQLQLKVIFTKDPPLITERNINFRKIFFPSYNYFFTPTFFYKSKQNQIFIKNKTKPKVGIIFFGLTRSINETIDSIQNNLFKSIIDADMEYDIYMHTYIINGVYHNSWSNEYVKKYDNDQYKLLNPTYFTSDNQEEILSQIHLEEYFTKIQSWTGYDIPSTKYLIRNMILALKSKKRVIENFENNIEEYDYVIITRPDLKFIKSIPWKEIIDKLTDKNIIMPSKDWWSGCNDKICICKPHIALYVGKLYDFLQKYSTYKSIVSEVFLKDMLNAVNIEINTCEIDYETIRMKKD